MWAHLNILQSQSRKNVDYGCWGFQGLEDSSMENVNSVVQTIVYDA